MTPNLRGLCGLLLGVGLLGCGFDYAPQPAKSSPPAQVVQVSQETELARVTLTPEAAERLGIKTATVELKPVRRQRTLGGEVIVPPGQSITVSAPYSGSIINLVPKTESFPIPGSVVEKGEPLFSLLPMLTPERSVLTPSERVSLAQAEGALAASRIEARGQVESAKVEVNAAHTELRRSEQLLRDSFGTQKEIDTATARFNKAQKDLDAALSREKLLKETILESDSGVPNPQEIVSPRDGILQDVFVAEGQIVTAGSAMLQIVNQEVLWIRVPVYVGDLDDIDLDRPAEIGCLGGDDSRKLCSAKPVDSAPPAANPITATVDLFYEVQSGDKTFRPGERVTVTVSLRDEEESLVVPWSSILHDIHGGTWVYEVSGDLTFIRSRVQVRFVQGEEAVLTSGPELGASIVTDGAVELFGTEFGNEN